MNKKRPLRRHKTSRFFRRDNILALCALQSNWGATGNFETRTDVSAVQFFFITNVRNVRILYIILCTTVFSRRFYRIKR